MKLKHEPQDKKLDCSYAATNRDTDLAQVLQRSFRVALQTLDADAKCAQSLPDHRNPRKLAMSDPQTTCQGIYLSQGSLYLALQQLSILLTRLFFFFLPLSFASLGSNRK